MTDDQRLVIPIGQFGGAIRHPGTDRTVYTIRRGHDLLSIEPDAGRVWLDAHSRSDHVETTALTRTVLLDRRRTSGSRESATRAYEQLLDDNLLAEIDPNGPEAVEFARTHRFVPSWHGKGNSAHQPAQFLAGFTPEPSAGFSWFLWRLWRESHLEPNLWDGCRALAVREDCVREQIDERTLVTETLLGLHVLLGRRLAYVDVARLPKDSGA